MKSEATEQSWLDTLLATIRRKRAERRLQQITDERRQSFECEDYRRRRAAAKKGMRRA